MAQHVLNNEHGAQFLCNIINFAAYCCMVSLKIKPQATFPNEDGFNFANIR